MIITKKILQLWDGVGGDILMILQKTVATVFWDIKKILNTSNLVYLS